MWTIDTIIDDIQHSHILEREQTKHITEEYDLFAQSTRCRLSLYTAERIRG